MACHAIVKIAHKCGQHSRHDRRHSACGSCKSRVRRPLSYTLRHAGHGTAGAHAKSLPTKSNISSAGETLAESRPGVWLPQSSRRRIVRTRRMMQAAGFIRGPGSLNCVGEAPPIPGEMVTSRAASDEFSVVGASVAQVFRSSISGALKCDQRRRTR